MTAATSAAPPALTPVRRLRVLVRRALFAALQAVPASVVVAVHDRWIAPDGRRSARWRPLATALFYRPVPLATIDVPGGTERMAVVGARMERLLWWYGEAGYEHGEAVRWRALCSRAENVLEVGANVGYYAVVGGLATRGGYTAVEANPEAAAVVRTNLALNGLDRVEVVEAAVVGRDAPAELELAFPDQETHTVAPMGSFLREGTENVADRAASRSVRVPTRPAGDLFAGRDLVKLDIEGSEAAVLDAAAEEIRRSRPIILVEVLAGSSRLVSVIADLVSDGYRLLAPAAALRPMALAELDGPENRDVLLVPRERADVG